MIENKKEIKDEDQEAVFLCKRGDTDAFESLVRKYQKKMLNIAYRIIGNYEEACEAVQDAFVSAHKNIAKFEEKSRFSTWIYAITVNLSRNRIKQIKTELQHEQFSFDNPVLTDDGSVRLEPVSAEPSILEKLEKRDIQKAVERCMNSLSAEFREVIVLRDIQEFSYDEICSMLNLADGTVKSRLFRARDSVKNCLKKILGGL